MTVLHLITGLHCGGAENQLQQLVGASDRRQFRHIVVSIVPGGELEPELTAAGVEVYSLGLKRGSLSPLGMLRLVRTLRRFRPDVLHCWMYHACLMGAVAVRMVKGPALVWGLRAGHSDLRDYNLITQWVIRFCAQLSSSPQAIAVNSQTAFSAHRELGYNTAHMRVVPNGIDTLQFSPNAETRRAVREELGLGHDHVLVGMFSRFDPMKDHASFFQAASAIYQRYPFTRFLLAGVGISPHNDPLSQMVAKNGLKDVTILLGPRRDVPRLTAALDIACLSSWTESFPNVVVEAMSSAVPCVVTDAGDSAFIVGDTGRVVPIRNARALAEALAELVGMPSLDRQALGARARGRVVENFSIERAVTSYEALYHECGGAGMAANQQPGASVNAI